MGRSGKHEGKWPEMEDGVLIYFGSRGESREALPGLLKKHLGVDRTEKECNERITTLKDYARESGFGILFSRKSPNRGRWNLGQSNRRLKDIKKIHELINKLTSNGVQLEYLHYEGDDIYVAEGGWIEDVDGHGVRVPASSTPQTVPPRVARPLQPKGLQGSALPLTAQSSSYGSTDPQSQNFRPIQPRPPPRQSQPQSSTSTSRLPDRTQSSLIRPREALARPTNLDYSVIFGETPAYPSNVAFPNYVPPPSRPTPSSSQPPSSSQAPVLQTRNDSPSRRFYSVPSRRTESSTLATTTALSQLSIAKTAGPTTGEKRTKEPSTTSSSSGNGQPAPRQRRRSPPRSPKPSRQQISSSRAPASSGRDEGLARGSKKAASSGKKDKKLAEEQERKTKGRRAAEEQERKIKERRAAEERRRKEKEREEAAEQSRKAYAQYRFFDPKRGGKR